MARRPKGSIIDQGSATGMTEADLDRYDLMIRNGLSSLARMHQIMDQNRDLVHNRKEGRLWGNLVSNHARMLVERIKPSKFTFSAQSRDPEAKSSSANLTVIINSLAEVGGLYTAVAEAVKDSMWASYGMIEIGHPQDHNCLDPMRSYKSKHTPTIGSQELDDKLVPMDKEALIASGVDLDKIQARDSQYISDKLDEGVKAAPALQESGYPWAVRVDPRMIVLPEKGDLKNHAFIGRLRWVSVAELKRLTGKEYSTGTMFQQYWQYDESGIEWLHTENQMVLICEVTINRDLVKPDLNGISFAYLVGRTKDGFIKRERTAFIKYELISLQAHSSIRDPSIAEELMPYAVLYSNGIKSIAQDLLDGLNSPLGIEPGSDLDENQVSQIKNPKSREVIKGVGKDSVHRIIPPGTANQDLLRNLLFVKSASQSVSNTSNLDEGIPVGSITAHQSQALLDATGIAMSQAKDAVRDILIRGIIKFVHLVEMRSESTKQGMKFAWGGRAANWSWSSVDVASSFSFEINAVGRDEGMNSESLLLLNQVIGVISKEQRLGELADWDALYRELITAAGLPQDLGLTDAEKERKTQEAMDKLRAASSGMQQPGMAAPSPLTPGMGGGLPLGPAGDMFAGEHAERQIGSRGTGQSVAHAQAGLAARNA